MRRVLCIAAFFCLFIFHVSADSFKTLDQAARFCGDVVELFSDGQFQEAVDKIKPYYPSSPVTLDNMAFQAQQQWGIIEESYGSKNDVESLEMEKVGKSLAKITHIVRFERYALVFDTTLYRPRNQWVIVGFTFNDTLDALFE